jgi:transcriptional regulator with XRE-family HTH domain
MPGPPVQREPDPQHPHAELRAFLTTRRKDLGITQAQLAERMGTTQSAVSELENVPRCNPTLDTLTRWAGALDLELAVQVTEKIQRSFTIAA